MSKPNKTDDAMRASEIAAWQYVRENSGKKTDLSIYAKGVVKKLVREHKELEEEKNG